MPRRFKGNVTLQEDSRYKPPGDDIDQLVNKVDQGGNDKYRAIATERVWSTVTTQTQSQFGDESRFDSVASDGESKSGIASGPQSMDFEDPRQQRRPPQSVEDLYQLLEESDYYAVKQKFAYLSIGITAVQILVLMLQLSLCGVAPWDVNRFVGPYPDAVSDWGGKNAYLMKEKYQYWRLITPAFLHVGVIHLLVNAAVQLETCAFFEREWGSVKFFWMYTLGEIGCVLVSSSANPETLAVGSSGALMALFGAKLSQVLTQVLFDSEQTEDDSIRIEQLSTVMCSLAIIFILSFFTYIDWSGHMGGMATGFVCGILAFSRPIRYTLSRILWRLLGFTAFAAGTTLVVYYWLDMVETEEALGDPCEYFRNLFAEGYDCTCELFG